MPVNATHHDYDASVQWWIRCRDCYDGSDAIKAKKSAYLPPLASHSRHPDRYDAYLKRALFFNATQRTVDGFAGVIFQNEPEIDFPEQYMDQLEDVTLSGEPLELFAQGLTREVLKVGRYGVLVDMSTQEEKTLNRPYWAGYFAEDIVNWKIEFNGGDPELTRVVLKEIIEEPGKDEFTVKNVPQYRVLLMENEIYKVRIYKQQRENDDTSWEMIDEKIPNRRKVPLNFIPFIFFSYLGITHKVIKPPLLDMVDVNISHFQTSADLEHGRHLTALPTPWVSGIAGSQEGPLPLGSEDAWVLEVNGRAGMLEFSGSGIGALVTAEGDKRRLMAILGARLLEEQPDVAETAKAVSMRHSGEHSTLRTTTQALEQGLTKLLQIHAWWCGTEVNFADVKAILELNKDFFATKATPQELQAWIAAWQAEAMSWETLYNLLTRGRLTRPGVEADQEKKDIKNDPAPTAAVNQPDPNLEKLNATNSNADQSTSEKTKAAVSGNV